eukprot:2128569-Amphidinium_carterae.2
MFTLGVYRFKEQTAVATSIAYVDDSTSRSVCVHKAKRKAERFLHSYYCEVGNGAPVGGCGLYGGKPCRCVHVLVLVEGVYEQYSAPEHADSGMSDAPRDQDELPEVCLASVLYRLVLGAFHVQRKSRIMPRACRSASPELLACRLQDHVLVNFDSMH